MIFAVVNVLFTRMIFAWVDRWLSTRRAREAFTALIFLISIAAQGLNFAYNPAYHNRRMDLRKIQAVQSTLTRVERYVSVLPPELAGRSVAAAAWGRVTTFALLNLASAAWGCVFLLVFAQRMSTEYRGENLSDPANVVRAPKAAKHEVAHTTTGTVFVSASARPADVTRVVAAKELLYLRRNTGLFYGLIMPLLMVLIFAGKWSSKWSAHGSTVVMAALAYGLIGVFPMAFNTFGLDGAGAQTYFFAPVRLREVLMGKNVLCAGLAIAETLAILVVLSYTGRMPSLVVILGGLLWMVTTLLVELTVGNYMSIRSPKRIDPGRTAQKQARPASAFLSMGIVLASGLVGGLVTYLAGWEKLDWIVPIVFACTAAAAGFIYLQNLNKLDAYGWLHRDALFEELQRKA
jgi:ABC-2 type transport system permease protein